MLSGVQYGVGNIIVRFWSGEIADDLDIWITQNRIKALVSCDFMKRAELRQPCSIAIPSAAKHQFWMVGERGDVIIGNKSCSDDGDSDWFQNGRSNFSWRSVADPHEKRFN